MGVSYGAGVYVGVLVSESVEDREEKEVVTRYDEKTGKPYEKPLTNDLGKFFGDTKIDGIYDLESDHNFDIGYGGGYEDESEHVVGKKLVSVGNIEYGGSTEEIDNDKIDVVIKEVTEQLLSLGVKIKPRVFLCGWCG